jgi:acyl CoA:acetate/3-ketoacid CoA transferase
LFHHDDGQPAARRQVRQHRRADYLSRPRRRHRGGHRPTIITERAVFEVAAQGLMLTEIAKGVDVKKDILEQMEFEVRRRSAQGHG